MKKSNLRNSVKGGALLPALVLSFVLTSIGFSFILHNYLLKEEYLNDKVLTDLERNCDSGINLLTSDLASDGRYDSVVVDLYEKGTDSVLLKKFRWGLYEVVSSKAFKGKQQRSKVLLIGKHGNEELALYMEEMNMPLTLSGSAALSGICYVSKAGIRSAILNGTPFTGTLPKQILRSQDNLRLSSQALFPELDEDLSRYQQISTSSDIPDSLQRKFQDMTVKLLSLRSLVLDLKNVSGNVQIRSLVEVVITKEACLSDIIVIAPKIRICKGFNGSLQCVATDSIIVEEDVNLRFPSALVFVQLSLFQSSTPGIVIRKNSKIEGSVVAYAVNAAMPVHQIIVNKGVLITGEIVSDSKVSLEGQVYGRVICKDLFAERSSYYDHFMIDGEIHPEKLPPSYAFSGLFNPDDRSMNKIIHALQ